MNLQNLMAIFVLLPFITFIISLLIPSKNEKALSQLAFAGTVLQFILLIFYTAWWAVKGLNEINIKEIILYKTENYEFLIDFYFDKITAVYLFTGAFITSLIVRYSRYYMHMENGYKRFFNTVLFFFAAYNLTSLAGNFETLFLGWEMLGISSFLLIAFYRERYLPSRNAVKVFSIYRIGDVGILLAMWASHHLWHENITFMKLNNEQLVHEHLLGHSTIGLFISISILIAAAAKSAQIPFSSWLPRAMEGPTPSSAIFYGSLSVHFGVFLLLRTEHFWGEQLLARIIIGAVGFITALIAYPIARVQSTIKTQIAYASVAQIGIMFLEIAFGLETLALIHFMGNAFLRTYQLLISPSVVAYLIRDMFYHFKPKSNSIEDGYPKKLQYSLYILSLKEFNLDLLINKLIFNPIKKIGNKLTFINYRNSLLFILPLIAVALVLKQNENNLSENIKHTIPLIYSFIGFLLVLKSFAERKYPRLSVMLVLTNHILMAIGISFNEHFGYEHILIYLSGIIPSAILAIIVLNQLKKKEPNYFDLSTYYGHVYEYKLLAFLFLIASLGLMGFPITPSFIGEDLIFSHIHENQVVLAFFFASSYIISGIALIRVYSRLFHGNHIKKYHSTALKSA
jgi:NADH:ubiquinone oxidoreductase subunit 5 (subunit L)/multisubunit Na+/H+ antiporter MnhA subunit